MKKQILVTGGSGFLGINLIRFLLGKDYGVKSIDLEPFTYPEKDKVDWLRGDVRREKDLRKAMEGVAAVVHCAAALPLYTREEIFSTDVGGTKMVLVTAKKMGVKRVVFISSTAVYGVPDHHPLWETDELVGVGPYGEAKIEAEEVCREFRRQGMCVPVVRPKSFVGPERLGAFALLYDWARTGHGFPMIGSGGNRYQLLDVADLCEAIYLCLTLPEKKVNDIFNIGAEEFTTLKEDFQAVLDKAGFGKKIKCFPQGPVIFGLRILEKLRLSPLYQWIYETAGKDSFVAVEKAKKVLGWTARFSNKEALIRNYEWYVANETSFRGKSGKTHRLPWNQGALGLAKSFF